jgi:inner membrane protein
VVAERVEMRGRTLRWLVNRIDPGRTYYLLGEVEISDGKGLALAGQLDSIETYNPASYRGGILRLHYARAPESGAVARSRRGPGRGGGAVLAHKPGEVAVTLGTGEEQREERMPEQLRRFL